VTFLPIVERELRTAARKPSTFWLRVAAASIGLMIGTGFLFLRSLGGMNSSMLGQVVFGILTWAALLAALAGGLFLTSDCLSEEKREGTLGFLFLTDLKGYDVVGGKLLASSLRAFYALLSLLPILAITVLMGGVTGEQFWKTALALVNALLFSLAIGMLVSAFSRDSQKALSATLLLLLLFNLGAPLIDGLVAGLNKRGFIAQLSLASPGYLFTQAAGWSSVYWYGLIVNQALIWFAFLLTSVFLPRTWQEKAAKVPLATMGWTFAWKYGSSRRRFKLREKWLSRDPIVWLACRERWQAIGIWTIAILVLIGFIALLFVNTQRGAWFLWMYLGSLYTFIFYLWTASQSTRFLFEARRSGLMELLLATPVGEKQMAQGHWRAFIRMFGFPLIILMGVHIAGSGLSQHSFAAMIRSSGGGEGAQVILTLLSVFGNAMSAFGNIVAICWFGMWMGMTSRSANLATLKTIVFVQILPVIVIYFVSSALVMRMMFMGVRAGSPGTPGAMLWYPAISSLCTSLIVVAKDIGFILWSRKKLYHSLRFQAGSSIGQPRSPDPSIPPVPPVIPKQQSQILGPGLS
jgi:hypothetical protein